ncbi:DUF6327 family protein [Maribacter aestuarii]|uniref:DUF6327 family protein n=1 Tax=Maribacter aestuarii TaxID=1130723 RepID=UPI003D3230A2
MNTRYNSFEEIDTRLKILKLQREINRESLKINLNQAKINIVPRKLVKNISTSFTHGTTWKNLLICFLAKKALNLLRKGRGKEVQ